MRQLGYIALALAASLIATSQAGAQENRAQLSAANNASITSNGMGAITGPVLNNLLGQVITGMGVQNDTNTWTGANTFSSLGNSLFFATAYGKCTWDSTHDVQPCVQAAQTAAAAVGGGTVVVPAGNFGLANTLINQSSGVHLVAAGVGVLTSTQTPRNFQAITKFTWIGAADGTMYHAYPTGVQDGSQFIYSVDVQGIVFDGANTAAVCTFFEQVSSSVIQVGASNCRKNNNYFFVQAPFVGGSGGINNDLWLYSYSTSASFAPVGNLLDAGPNAWQTIHNNRIHELYALFSKGDGNVLGYSDNNLIENIDAVAGTGASGRPTVFTSWNETLSNGQVIHGGASSNIVLHNVSNILVDGYAPAATIVANPANACNGGGISACGPTTATHSITNTTPGWGNGHITMDSVSSVAIGETINCAGGYSVGVLPGVSVYTIDTNDVYFLPPQATMRPINPGVACTFSFGLTNALGYGLRSDPTSITETITATGPSTYSITPTAPFGNAQTGISPSAGIITFKDFVSPWAGTATTGDSWVITINRPSRNNYLYQSDLQDGIQDPNFLVGSSGVWSDNMDPNTYIFNGATPFGLVLGAGGASAGCTNIGYFSPSCTGNGAINLGGYANDPSGVGATTFGYHVTASGTYSAAHGYFATASGFAGDAVGEYPNDFQLINTSVRGAGSCNGTGSCQSISAALAATGAGGSTVTLTTDGTGVSNFNVLNLKNDNSSESLTITVDIHLQGSSTSESWNSWAMKLKRGTGAASTTLTAATTPTPLDGGVGGSISAAADTTHGGLNLSVTFPAGGTWTATAHVIGAEAF